MDFRSGGNVKGNGALDSILPNSSSERPGAMETPIVVQALRRSITAIARLRYKSDAESVVETVLLVNEELNPSFFVKQFPYFPV